MKCKICRAKAVAELPQHRMALCQPCYLDWFPSYAKKTIKKFAMLDHGERVLVAISGGKDSSALWRVLVDLGYAADAMIIDLGIGDQEGLGLEGERYSSSSTEFAREQAQLLGRDLWVIDLREQIGRSVPELRRGRQGDAFRGAGRIAGAEQCLRRGGVEERPPTGNRPPHPRSPLRCWTAWRRRTRMLESSSTTRRPVLCRSRP